MSEIARSLVAQEAAGEAPDVGKVFKKLLGDIPVTNYDEERRRYVSEQRAKELKEAFANAQGKSR